MTTPVRDRFTAGSSGSSFVTVSVADFVPSVDARKDTVTVHEESGASVVQVFVWLNSAASVPDMLTPLIVRVVEPSFVTVTGWAAGLLAWAALLAEWIELTTSVGREDRVSWLSEAETDPLGAKRRLAAHIVDRYHGAGAGNTARDLMSDPGPISINRRAEVAFFGTFDAAEICTEHLNAVLFKHTAFGECDGGV